MQDMVSDMAKILDILKEFLEQIEEDNPYGLVLKGGTALSLYYLNNHRESEDLDFDADTELRSKHKEILAYLKSKLESQQRKKVIQGFNIKKAGFAATDRYHINLELHTHKTFQTKIDIDFVKLPHNLLKRGELHLYKVERIFITKLITFSSRKEFKDLYDIAHLLDKVDASSFTRKENVAELVDNTIRAIEQEDMQVLFRSAFRNADLRFRDVKESSLKPFIIRFLRKLRVFSNELKR